MQHPTTYPFLNAQQQTNCFQTNPWAQLPSMNHVIQQLFAASAQKPQTFFAQPKSVSSTATSSPTLNHIGGNSQHLCANPKFLNFSPYQLTSSFMSQQIAPQPKTISPFVIFQAQEGIQQGSNAQSELNNQLSSIYSKDTISADFTRESQNIAKQDSQNQKGDYYCKVSQIEELKDKFKDLCQSFKGEDDIIVRVQTGSSFDLNSVRIKKHVPCTKNYRIFTFKNPRSKRQVKVLQCDECSKQFKKWHNFFDHLRIHTRERPYVCPQEDCDYSFTQKANLNKHIELHTGLKRFACKTCDKSFFTNFNLKSHMKTHRRKEDMIGGTQRQTILRSK
eukprot:403332178